MPFLAEYEGYVGFYPNHVHRNFSENISEVSYSHKEKTRCPKRALQIDFTCRQRR